jgi:hypothetical protein
LSPQVVIKKWIWILNKEADGLAGGNKPVRILFVAQAVSVHTAHWIRQVQDQGWDLHLFDMLGSFPHPELQGITEYSLLFPRKIPLSTKPAAYGHPFFMSHGWDPFPLSLAGFFLRRVFRQRARRLAGIIRSLKPDVIHSFELQTESYHLLHVADLLGGSLGAPWIVTTWGSDIFYFQRFPEHLERIKQILRRCDYLIPDCTRDVTLAREYGFKGVIPLVVPGPGGYPLEEMRRSMTPGLVSRRRLIMLKGYQGWAGRALNALQALEESADALRDYRIVVYGASPILMRRIRELRNSKKLDVEVLPRSPHGTILELFGRSRLAIGVNATDGIPNAMLEAMTMGALPIQSDTVSTSEWITNGVNGLLVDASQPADIARAIRKALQDDALVERASDLNAQLMAQRIDLSVVKPKVIEMYKTAVRERMGVRR